MPLLCSKVRSLGAAESDEDDDGTAASWVAKIRKKEKEKLLAEKRVSGDVEICCCLILP